MALTQQQKRDVAKLLDAVREWNEWQEFTEYKAALRLGKPLKAASMDGKAALICRCGYVAKNGLALNGHMLKHRGGK
jgi:hypothetical protein